MKVSKRANNLIAKLSQGNLSSAEMAELSELAKDDPFLNDAMEGYANHPLDYSESLQGIRKNIRGRGQNKWRLRVAAAMLVVAGLSLFLFNINRSSSSVQLALEVDSAQNALSQESNMARVDLADEVELESDIPSINNPKEAQALGIPEEASPSTPAISADQKAEMDLAASEESMTPVTDEKNETLAFRQEAARPVIEIRGRVFDNVGEPLMGASLLQANLGIETLTDHEGHFILNTPDTNEDLSISLTGYKSKVVTNSLSPNEPLDIRLEEVRDFEDVAVATPARARRSTPLYNATKEDQDSFQDYLDEHLQYPKAALDAGIEGQVELSFGIDVNGRPKDIRITRSLGYGCDQEAIRLLENGPKWTPSENEHSTDSSTLTIQIPFELN